MQEFRRGRRRLLLFQEGAGRPLLLLHGAAAERDEEEWDISGRSGPRRGTEWYSRCAPDAGAAIPTAR